MTGNMPEFFWTFVIFIIMLMVTGLYCIVVTRNLIRSLIGIELLTKGVTLLFIVIGHITGQTGLAQAMVITMIVIEVVVIVIAGGIILSAYRHYESLDTKNLRNFKG